jgi:hypothetical protein
MNRTFSRAGSYPPPFKRLPCPYQAVMLTRNATFVDTIDIRAIYAHHVLHGTGSFDETQRSVGEAIANFCTVTGRGRS